jgi:hypothetical protein
VIIESEPRFHSNILCLCSARFLTCHRTWPGPDPEGIAPSGDDRGRDFVFAGERLLEHPATGDQSQIEILLFTKQSAATLQRVSLKTPTAPFLAET